MTRVSYSGRGCCIYVSYRHCTGGGVSVISEVLTRDVDEISEVLAGNVDEVSEVLPRSVDTGIGVVSEILAGNVDEISQVLPRSMDSLPHHARSYSVICVGDA